MTESTRKKITKWFWILITFPVLLLIVMIFLVWAFADIPSFKDLENPDNKLATQVIAEDGEILTTFHIENRTYVSYDEISPNLVHAAVATEDVRFYKHSGIDFKGLGRVLVKTIVLRNSSQGGGSTITQQLAKTLYPRADVGRRIPGIYHAKMVWVKLKEWITAVKLERDYTKDEIMTMYLNSIFFGSGAYGVRAASETFFGKLPSDLTVEESAMLVGMVNKPTRYNPAINPDKALTRRNFVIGQMEKAGYLDKAQRDSIRLIPIELNYEVQDHNAGLAPYFRDMVRRVMNARKPRKSDYYTVEDYSADSLAWTSDDLYGWLEKNKKADGSKYDLDRDGLRIYTTINYKMQKYAEEAVAERIRDLQADFRRDLRSKTNKPFSNDIDTETRDRVMRQARRWSDRYRVLKKEGKTEAQILKTFSQPVKMRVFAYNKKGYADTTMTPDDSIRYYKSILRTAFVAMEPGTGHVKAYVGGPNYRYFKYDNVRQGKRQVGSTIKPFLYSLAMENGFTPCSMAPNVQQSYRVGNQTWTPRNANRKRYGEMVSLKWGLAQSNNWISAYLMSKLNPQQFVSMLHDFGINNPEIVPSMALCLGPCEVSVAEMVSAYTTFANKGIRSAPMFVSRIEDNEGNVITDFQPRLNEVINAESANRMLVLLKGVVDGGTGGRLRFRYHFTGEIGAKTGTTNRNADAWFMGFTPQLVSGCWVGGEDRDIHFDTMRMGQGATMALPIWAYYMKKVYADPSLPYDESVKFDLPEGYDGCSSGESSADGAEDALDIEEVYE